MDAIRGAIEEYAPSLKSNDELRDMKKALEEGIQHAQVRVRIRLGLG